MDTIRFDALTRTVSSRRVLGGAMAGTLAGLFGFSPPRDAAAAPCPNNKKRCGKKCIPKHRCCTSAQCKTKKSGKVCKKGRCVCPGGMKRCGKRCVLKAAACPPKPDASCPSGGSLGLRSVGRRYAQTFTEPNGGRLIAVEIRIRNQSASTIGFYDLRLHTVDPASGMPHFTTLAVANRLADHISDTTAEWVRFNFPVPQRLQPGSMCSS